MSPTPFDTEMDGPHCHKCGYLLRGVRSSMCTECGEPRTRRLSYFDRMQFDAIRAALDLADVPHTYADPSLGAIAMHNMVHGFNFQPILTIRWTEQLRLEQAIESVGLTPPVALIDEIHPYCPCCGFLLVRPEVGETRCTVCNTLCAWYDPDDEDEDEGEDEDEYDAMERAADGPR